MPRKNTPRWQRAYGWLRGEDFWGDPTSENRVVYDMLMHPSVLSMTQSEPPLVVSEGDMYIVPSDAGGAWSGHENELAMYVEASWFFVPPIDGVRVRVRDLNKFVWWDEANIEWKNEAISGVPEPEVGTRYDIAISVGYAPEPGETLLMLPIVQAMALPQGAPGSVATIITPPATTVMLPIYRNGAEVAAVVFHPSGFSGILNVPSNIVFAPGDRLRMKCPEELPPGFGEFGIVLRMGLQ